MNIDLLYFYIILVILSYITPRTDCATISRMTFKLKYI